MPAAYLYVSVCADSIGISCSPTEDEGIEQFFALGYPDRIRLRLSRPLTNPLREDTVYTAAFKSFPVQDEAISTFPAVRYERNAQQCQHWSRAQGNRRWGLGSVGVFSRSEPYATTVVPWPLRPASANWVSPCQRRARRQELDSGFVRKEKGVRDSFTREVEGGLSCAGLPRPNAPDGRCDLPC